MPPCSEKADSLRLVHAENSRERRTCISSTLPSQCQGSAKEENTLKNEARDIEMVYLKPSIFKLCKSNEDYCDPTLEGHLRPLLIVPQLFSVQYTKKPETKKCRDLARRKILHSK